MTATAFRVLETVHKFFPDSLAMRGTWLAFTTHHHRYSGSADVNPKAARQLAKRLLKNDANNVRLWEQYAQEEIKAANWAEAKKVLETALTLLANLPPAAHADAPILFYALLQVVLITPVDGAAHIEEFKPPPLVGTLRSEVRPRQTVQVIYNHIGICLARCLLT